MAQAREQQEQKPRKLTTYQKAVLIQVLRIFPNERVEIRYALNDDDALAYAQDFLAVFKAILWDVEGPQPDPGAPVGLTLVAGAQFRVTTVRRGLERRAPHLRDRDASAAKRRPRRETRKLRACGWTTRGASR